MADLASHPIFDCDFAFYDTLQNCAHSLYLLLFHFNPTIPKTIRNARCVPRWLSVISKLSSSECAPRPSPPPSIVIAGTPRLIGKLESVLPEVNFVLIPSA